VTAQRKYGNKKKCLLYFGTRPLGTPRTWEHNIKTIVRERGLGGDAWSWLKFMTRESLRNKRFLPSARAAREFLTLCGLHIFPSEFNFEIMLYFELK
jgi:hypothetical protein